MRSAVPDVIDFLVSGLQDAEQFAGVEILDGLFDLDEAAATHIAVGNIEDWEFGPAGLSPQLPTDESFVIKIYVQVATAGSAYVEARSEAFDIFSDLDDFCRLAQRGALGEAVPSVTTCSLSPDPRGFLPIPHGTEGVAAFITANFAVTAQHQGDA